MRYALLADFPQAVPFIARWYFEEWGAGLKGNTYEKTCERLQGKLNRDRLPLHLLAIDEQQVVGVAGLKIREMDLYADRTFWLGSVYVDPGRRGAGIGSELIQEIVKLGRGLDIKVLNLQTEQADGGVYARLGWSPIERVRYHGVDVTVMERTL